MTLGGALWAPSTLLIDLYLTFFSLMPGRLSGAFPLTVISIIGSSIVTLGRALMEPSALDLYGFGSVRSLVPF